MEKYVAYVSSYTRGSSKGITIYYVDLDQGTFIKKNEIEAENPSYMVTSNSGKFLYVGTDYGINSYKIEADGGLIFLNTAPINGMRASHISITEDDKYLFASGFHDGKLTVLRIGEDGLAGEITDEIYDKGVGKVLEPNSTPHITCSAFTGDKEFLAVCDLGIDQIKINKFDTVTGKLRMVDIIRGDLQMAPRSILFSQDGRFAYVARELKNEVAVYSYELINGEPVFELIENVLAVQDKATGNAATSTIKMTSDNENLLCTNAGDDTITIFKRDNKTGKLSRRSVLPISGEFPKDIIIFPDNRHIASLNHSSGEITFFATNFETGNFTMSAKPVQNDSPNCGLIIRLWYESDYMNF